MKKQIKQFFSLVLSMAFVMAAAFTFGFLIVWLVITLTGYQPKSIVQLENWEHGVALCGEEGKGTVVDEDFISINRNGIYLLVNDGHHGDPELVQLYKKALVHCARYE